MVKTRPTAILGPRRFRNPLSAATMNKPPDLFDVGSPRDTPADAIGKTIALKPTGAVQIANRFSLIERKLMNGIIWHAQKNRFDSQEYSMPILQVFQIIGLESSRNHEVIKDALRTLTGTLIEWNQFGDDKTQEWGVCTFLAAGKISRGQVRYRLNPEIVDKIKHPVLFAKIQLLIQSQFKKRHALVLYEFFIDLISRQRAEKIVIDDVPLDRIQTLLGLDKTKSTEEGNFKFFNRDVLKPSIDEINNFSDIKVLYKPLRKQRRVAALMFTVERPPPFRFLFDLLEHESTEVQLDSIEDDDRVLKQLIDKGVGLRKARQLLENYPIEQIQANIEHVAEAQKNRKIKNVAAYLVRAIEENYSRKSPEQARTEAASTQLRLAVEAKETEEQLEKEWERFCFERLRVNFSNMPTVWQEERRGWFIEKIRQDAHNGNNLLYQRFQKEGFDSPLVESCFLNELRGALLTRPEETALADFKVWRGPGWSAN